LRIALEAFQANQNIAHFDRDGLLKAVPYLQRASSLSTQVQTELNLLLLESLLADQPQKSSIMAKFNTLAVKFQTQPFEKALVYYFQGYMSELLFGKIESARKYWKLARDPSYFTLHENFWDAQEVPDNYPRYHSMEAPTYVRFLHPLLVYYTFQEQYTGEISPGEIPTFDADENRLKESETRGAEIAVGFDISMGRQNVDKASEFLLKNEFVFLRHFFSMSEVNLLTEFYQGNVINQTWASSYDPYLMRTNVYNDRLGFYINKQKEKLMNKLTGTRKVKMAYSFLCHYEDFGKREMAFNGRPNLKAHTDRKDNEITVSVTLGNSPLWPLFVHTKRVPNPGSHWREVPPASETVEVRVRTGDALVFMGRQHTHWREPMPADVNKYSSILYHYVDWDFDYIKYRKYGEEGNY